MSRRDKKNAVRAKQHQLQRAQREARAATIAAQRRRYWHGGTPGLQPGDVLLSREEAAAQGLRDARRQAAHCGYISSPDKVYFSTDREFARAYAGMLELRDSITGVIYQRGTLYEVEPIGDIEPDPDFKKASWCSPQARVLSVAEVNVPLDNYAAVQRLGRYMSWSDGSPIYDRDGRFRPSPEQVAGMDPAALSELTSVVPRWMPVEHINVLGTGEPSGDRPNPADFPNILYGADEAIVVATRHRQRATRMVAQQIQFTDDDRTHRDALNRLLADHTELEPDDPRGAIIAVHPRDGVIGAAVVSASEMHGHLITFIDAVAVSPHGEATASDQFSWASVTKYCPGQRSSPLATATPPQVASSPKWATQCSTRTSN